MMVYKEQLTTGKPLNSDNLYSGGLVFAHIRTVTLFQAKRMFGAGVDNRIATLEGSIVQLLFIKGECRLTNLDYAEEMSHIDNCRWSTKEEMELYNCMKVV